MLHAPRPLASLLIFDVGQICGGTRIGIKATGILAEVMPPVQKEERWLARRQSQRPWLIFDVGQKMKVAALLLFIGVATMGHGAEWRTDYSVDADVRVLMGVKLFAFDLVALR